MPFGRTLADEPVPRIVSESSGMFGRSDDVGHALDGRLPNVAALLGSGLTDWRTVQLIISRTGLITGST